METADLLTRLIGDGTSQYPCQGHDRIEDPLGSQYAAGPPPALVRGSLGKFTAAG
jgi:hypothetical protein